MGVYSGVHGNRLVPTPRSVHGIHSPAGRCDNADRSEQVRMMLLTTTHIHEPASELLRKDCRRSTGRDRPICLQWLRRRRAPHSCDSRPWRLSGVGGSGSCCNRSGLRGTSI
eukprot:347286-Prymnesium_polylepis.1